MTGWWYIPLPGGSAEKCAISKDDNRIYMVSRSQGVYIIDISNKNNLNLTVIGVVFAPLAYFPVINE